MIRFILFLFLFPNLLHADLLAQHHVLYGERELVREQLAIYMDQEAHIYPDYYIDDSSLRACHSSLNDWYQKHEIDFARIAKKYKCGFEKYTPIHAAVLNDSIISFLAQGLNARAKNNSLTFLVHGFRRPFKPSGKDYTSSRDYGILENALGKDQGMMPAFVEIYWDALYMPLSFKTFNTLFEIFEQAQRNAITAGKTLRQVLTQVHSDTLRLVSHSLGAAVIANSLFDKEGETYIFPTPNNKRINILFIAPAISGIEISSNYYKRKDHVHVSSNDNYRLAIAYNENDRVLKKKWGLLGPGPYKHGNTTLGCNYHHAATDLQDYFHEHFPNSLIQLFDLSAVGECHHLRCYCADENLKEASQFIGN